MPAERWWPGRQAPGVRDRLLLMLLQEIIPPRSPRLPNSETHGLDGSPKHMDDTWSKSRNLRTQRIGNAAHR